MLKSVLLLGLIVSTVAVIPLFEGMAKSPRPPVGTALAPVTASHTHCPWVNLMRCASEFVVKTSSHGWVDPKTLTLREDGYPPGLAEGRIATLSIASGLSGHYSAGPYTLEFQGTGRVSVSGDATATESSTSPVSFDVTPGDKGITITLLQSSPASPIQGMVLRVASHSRDLVLEPLWHNLAKGFAAFSFVHWQREESSDKKPVSSWAQRPKDTYFTYATSNGVPHEAIIETLRLLPNADAYVAVPQVANEDYMRQMATLYATGLGSARTLYLVDSFAIGWLSDPSTRIDRYKLIYQIFSTAFASKTPPSPTLKVVLTCTNAEISWVYIPFLEPTSRTLDKDFKRAITAVAIPGVTLAAAGSEYMRLRSYQDDVTRIAREQMWEDEIDWFSFASRLALLDLPLIAYEGGPLLAVPMYNNVFRRPNSTEAAIERTLAANFAKFESENNAGLADLWVEYLERWYRNGGGLVMAGKMVAQGIKCKEHSSDIQGMNRYQCGYQGLTQWVDSAGTANKMKGVREWIADKNRSKSLLRNVPPAPLPTCNPTCLWGHCSMDGKCVCDNGYSGVSCDAFTPSALPNGCSPEDYGINIGGLADWEPVWMWSDFMNFARPWIQSNLSGSLSISRTRISMAGCGPTATHRSYSLQKSSASTVMGTPPVSVLTTL